MGTITDWLSGLSGAAVYAVVAALVFCEDALFFGFVIPGESAAVIGGVLAAQHQVSVYWLALIVVAAAIAGDSVGYEIGHRFGPRLLAARSLRRHQDGIESARDLIRRRGPVAVFLGRFVAFFRAVMPALAGASGMRYRTFLLFNALGGLVWGVGFTLIGYAAGNAYSSIEHFVGRGAALLFVGLVVVVLVVRYVRRRRRGGQETQDPQGSEDSQSPEGPEAPENHGGDGASVESDDDGAAGPTGTAHPGD
ncbi:DedA family protein [Streptomyces sp. SID10853]|uniref:VTT domain-containing protein n=1 Tax=Streptomyces sp. SID10853 TaxID=2706028 RepID=UPI0013C1F757|nr:DedA family protein [Streptomyces sp. SID10853]